MSDVLLIDAANQFNELVERALASAEINLAQTDSYHDGLELIQQSRPELVIFGMEHDHDRIAAQLQTVAATAPRLPIIMIGSSELPAPVLAAATPNLFDFVVPPVNPNELARSAQEALRTVRDSQLSVQCGVPRSVRPEGDALIGSTPEMHEIFKAIDRLARSDLGAVIVGAPGTGKKLVARSIHQRSRRRDRLIVTVDCSHPQDQLEAELFGGPSHRVSRLQVVAGGTLYLRHAERLPLPTQVRLLKLAQEQQQIAAHAGSPGIRLLAGTSASLEQMVAARAFREDLLQVLSAGRLELPPLRQRLHDLTALTDHFVQCFTRGADLAAKTLSRPAALALARHRWPGNVRELETVLQRANSFARTSVIEFGDLPADFLTSISPALLETGSFEATAADLPATDLADFLGLARRLFNWARRHASCPLIPAMERELIVHALAETQGNQVHAAKLLGITRATLRKRLHRFNIQREVYIH